MLADLSWLAFYSWTMTVNGDQHERKSIERPPLNNNNHYVNLIACQLSTSSKLNFLPLLSPNPLTSLYSRMDMLSFKWIVADFALCVRLMNKQFWTSKTFHFYQNHCCLFSSPAHPTSRKFIEFKMMKCLHPNQMHSHLPCNKVLIGLARLT